MNKDIKRFEPQANEKSMPIAGNKGKFALALGMFILNAYRRFFSIRMCIRGLENLPTGSKILTANHPNVSDVFLLPLLFNGNIRAVAQSRQFHQPFIGWILRNTGQIPVYPQRKHEAFQQACQALDNGDNVLIFPEGRLNPDNEELKIGSGAIRMAICSNAPIIPMGIYVSQKDTIDLSRGVDSLKRLYQVRGKFTVHIGKPWYLIENNIKLLTSKEFHELTGCLMDKIHALIKEAFEEHTLGNNNFQPIPPHFK